MQGLNLGRRQPHLKIPSVSEEQNNRIRLKILWLDVDIYCVSCSSYKWKVSARLDTTVSLACALSVCIHAVPHGIVAAWTSHVMSHHLWRSDAFILTKVRTLFMYIETQMQFELTSTKENAYKNKL